MVKDDEAVMKPRAAHRRAALQWLAGQAVRADEVLSAVECRSMA